MRGHRVFYAKGHHMKTLLLMRHAKSSWKKKSLLDIERPLSPRGEKDAPAMGRLLRKKELVPDLIIASPAVRARLTAEAVAEKSHYEKDVLFIDKLYMAEAPEILAALASLPEEVNSVLLIGHNPGLEYTLQLLTGKIVSLPTATIAYIKLPLEHWSELNGDCKGEFEKVWRPKD
jgi:phosphohistidine phosphatase